MPPGRSVLEGIALGGGRGGGGLEKPGELTLLSGGRELSKLALEEAEEGGLLAMEALEPLELDEQLDMALKFDTFERSLTPETSEMFVALDTWLTFETTEFWLTLEILET